MLSPDQKDDQANLQMVVPYVSTFPQSAYDQLDDGKRPKILRNVIRVEDWQMHWKLSSVQT